VNAPTATANATGSSMTIAMTVASIGVGDAKLHHLTDRARIVSQLSPPKIRNSVARRSRAARMSSSLMPLIIALPSLPHETRIMRNLEEIEAVPVATTHFVRALEGAQTSLQQEGIARS